MVRHGIESVQCENATQVALHAAVRPLLRLEDGHVLATFCAIVLALCEGRTGLAISGVFGAGKTRSAAVLLAGLKFNSIHLDGNSIHLDVFFERAFFLS